MTADPIRVLVVDDDFMVAKLHSAWVWRTEGFTVVGVAHTAEQATAAVAELRPDLLLLDVYLPDRSGIELLRELRAEAAELDVLVVTAAREVATLQQALRGGVVDYIVKPFEYALLHERLQQYAARHAALPAAITRQTDVDSVRGAAPALASPTAARKGVTSETEEVVASSLRGCGGDMSAAECAAVTGLSRVSARRYLEHLAATGRAGVSLRYGTAGRPERRYRWTAG